MRRSSLAIAVATLGCIALLAACGSTAGKKIASRLGEHSIATHVAPPAAALITGREIAALPQSSAQRALFSLWSNLQWESWPDALSYYQPGLIRQIGAVQLLQAWKFNAAMYRTSKPHIESVTPDAGQVTIRYLLSKSNAAPVPSTITWERVNGKWTVYYDSSLDSALRAWAQAEAQQKISPGTTKLSPRAVAAGIRAGEIQDRYLAGRVTGNGR